MPTSKLQHALYAMITVFFTVHAYVFYSLYVVNGDVLMRVTNTSSVLDAIAAQGGVYMIGRFVPIWAVVLLEFVLAFTLEMVMGSPCSFRLAARLFHPKETHPVLFETAIISATAALMCPAMSLIAAFLYYPYYAGFDFLTLLANWLKLVCLNFPFALLGQLFFIQPLVRTIFKSISRRTKKNTDHEQQVA